MSISQMSSTMQKAIVDRVRKAVLDNVSEGKSAFVMFKGKEQYAPNSAFDLDAIRTSTNLASGGYESIVSRGGLQSLGESFAKLAADASLSTEEVSLATAAAEVLSKSSVYSGFKVYVEQHYGIGKATGVPSKNGFMYQRAKESDVKIATKTPEDVEAPPSNEDFISFRNLNHGDLKKVFSAYLQKQNIVDKPLAKYLEKNLDAGHLTGVFNIKVRNVFNLTVTQKDSEDYRSLSATSGLDSELNDIFTKMMLLLADADYLSSNIVRDVRLFSTTSKRVYTQSSPRVSVELQLRIENGKAGSKLSGLGGALNKLVKSADRLKSRVSATDAQAALGAALKNFATVAEYVENLGKAIDTETLSDGGKQKVLAILNDAKTAQTFFTTKGSDSLKDSIKNALVAIIASKPTPKAQFSKASVLTSIRIPSKKSPKKVVAVKKPKKPTIKIPNTVSKVLVKTESLSSLQSLLDVALAEQIQKNMGSGSSRNLLNYRTGRLAESAKVERLSESRQGMITAFYSYMKNPYATFSEAGRQSVPRTRDPKLLIAKSIREIGATLAYNRMRAVLI